MPCIRNALYFPWRVDWPQEALLHAELPCYNSRTITSVLPLLHRHHVYLLLFIMYHMYIAIIMFTYCYSLLTSIILLHAAHGAERGEPGEQERQPGAPQANLPYSTPL